MTHPPLGQPITLVSTDQRRIGAKDYHACNHKYLAAVTQYVGSLPLLLPNVSEHLSDADLISMLSGIDGILLTGSNTNTHPQFNRDQPLPEPYDIRRDQMINRVIQHAIDLNIPLLALCRGLQELNIALGGTLKPLSTADKESQPHQNHLHYPDTDTPLERQYAKRHAVSLTPNGQLSALYRAYIDDFDTNQYGKREEIMVNSVHHLAIDTLASSLHIEAIAADGTIEAVSYKTPHPFIIAVQWHPETDSNNDPYSRALFSAFGEAIKLRQKMRLGA